MRLTRASLSASLIALAALASAPPAGVATVACTGRGSCVAVRLPAPVTVQAAHARFQIDRSGRVREIAPRVLPFPRDAAWFPGTGAWYAMQHKHLVVGRWRRALWRSRTQFSSSLSLGVVIVGGHTIAFSYRRAGAEWLYLARLGHAERRIARNEFPVGWARGGFYTYRYRGRALLLRDDTGAVAATVVRSPFSYAYDQTSQNLYFIAGGNLMRARGAASQSIASLRRLGLAAHKPSVELVPLGGIVELLTNQRLILLNPDGSVFAETRLTVADGALAGDVAVAPDGHAAAFPSSPPSPPGRPSNAETVYVLRAGARTATAVDTDHIDPGGCVRWASVQWHGRWLLYAATGGYLAVIDSTGRLPAIELARIAQPLAAGGTNSTLTAYWSGQPPDW